MLIQHRVSTFMTMEIIKRAAEAGVTIVLSSNGTLEVTGNEASVVHWLPKLKEQKPNILAALQSMVSSSSQAGGYGCGRCGVKTYSKVATGWRCEGCGMIFEIIGGSRGPHSAISTTSQ